MLEKITGESKSHNEKICKIRLVQVVFLFQSLLGVNVLGFNTFLIATRISEPPIKMLISTTKENPGLSLTLL